jgi:hypothetical protein
MMSDYTMILENWTAVELNARHNSQHGEVKGQTSFSYIADQLHDEHNFVDTKTTPPPNNPIFPPIWYDANKKIINLHGI